MAQQIFTPREGAEELIVEIVAVGDDHDGGIVHGGMQNNASRKECHRKAFAGTLRMPDNANAMVTRLGVAGWMREVMYRDYLLGRILYCTCGNKWGARTQKTRKNRKGVMVERKTLTGVYFCRQNHKDLVSPDCPRHIVSKKADEEAWEKICGVVDRPEYLLSQARNLVVQPRANAANLHEERDRIEKELERINADRQWVITSARQGKFTNNDMEQQLATLTLQEISYKRDLSALGQTININALDNWEAKFEEYLADLQAGAEALKNTVPQNEEERHNLFLLKKQIVDTLVERVTIGKNGEINVEIRLDLLKILDQDAGLENLSPAAYSRRGETYIRIR